MTTFRNIIAALNGAVGFLNLALENYIMAGINLGVFLYELLNLLSKDE